MLTNLERRLIEELENIGNQGSGYHRDGLGAVLMGIGDRARVVAANARAAAAEAELDAAEYARRQPAPRTPRIAVLIHEDGTVGVFTDQAADIRIFSDDNNPDATDDEIVDFGNFAGLMVVSPHNHEVAPDELDEIWELSETAMSAAADAAAQDATEGQDRA